VCPRGMDAPALVVFSLSLDYVNVIRSRGLPTIWNSLPRNLREPIHTSATFMQRIL